ncbi:MAG: sodium/glutamate symporter [Clostridia bacterium]|nr:sodium/glutamate symporter [Clostridia bacterium]
MRKAIPALVICIVLICLTLTGCGKNENKIKIGTGSTGGNYFNYGTNLAKAVDEETDYTMQVKTTAGSAANLRLLSEGYVDMALVQSDTMAAAIDGKGVFADGKLSGFHSVKGLYDESVQIIVAKDSAIIDITDLKGKKVSLGEKDSGVLQNALDVLDACGISSDKITAEYLSFSDSSEALAKGDIDAFFVTASAPTTAVVSLADEADIRVISLTKETATRLISENSAYSENVIPAGTYKNQTEDIYTVGVTAVLVASDELSPDAEAAVLKILEKQNKELQDISFGVVSEEADDGKLNISFDMYMTLGLSVLVLYVGAFLRKKIKFLEVFCIPAPVIGGLIFAVLATILHATGAVDITYDETLKSICMIIFFTSVGFQANLKVLKSGGISLVIFLISVFALIVCQNGIALGLSKLLKIDPLIALCTGSIPMVGGHGTAGAFGQVLEDLGLEQATTLCTAAATFGLIMGSLMGGPVGRRLITKHDLLKTAVKEDATVLVEEEKKHSRSVSKYAPAAYQIAIAMGIGTILSNLLSKTGMTFPAYIGAMIIAAIMRNAGEYSGKITIHMGEINDIGGICLSLFLGIAMVTLKLWQLADLALPLIILLVAQTLFMFLFSYFVVYNIMGRNYDAAVLSAGTCGFGMGATPNAMANMQAITDKFAPSVKAYILVPIVGSMFADFINSLTITFFINLL